MSKRRLKKLSGFARSGVAREAIAEKNKKIHKAAGTIILEKRTNEDAEKKKLLLMRAGVACVMIIVFTAWIFNLKYQFKTNSNNNGKSSFNWEQTKTELNKAMSQIKQGISEIKQIQATKEQNTLPREPELTSEQINLLKGRLMSEAATGTASSSKK
jgi:hypothetical protein